MEWVVSLLGVIVSAITSISLVNWRLTALEDKVKNIEQLTIDLAVIKNDISYIKGVLEKIENK